MIRTALHAMSPKLKDYHLLRRTLAEDSSKAEEDTDSDHLEHPNSVSKNPTNPRAIPLYSLLIIVIFLSCSNLTFIIYWLRTTKITSPQCDEGSYYANLHRTVPIQIKDHTEFVSENVSAVAHLWEEELSGDPGVVALDDDFVKEKHLPEEAMPFPWDTSKSVFLLQGYHNLHCLRTIFRYTWTADRGLPQKIAFSHILHCLDQLRQDVICNADDTPRYAGTPSPDRPPGTGAGQIRMCKDWGQLEQWARKRTACFKHEDEVPGRMIDRFKFCPDGKVLWPVEN